MPRGKLPFSHTDSTGRVCMACKAYKPWSGFYVNRKGSSGYTARCKACLDAVTVPYKKDYHLARKRRVMDAYGGRCACCGESEPMFLTIDHMNDDGAAHRRAINSPGGQHFYGWLIGNGFPDGFQILCWNCNSGREANGGTCPHQMPRLCVVEAA